MHAVLIVIIVPLKILFSAQCRKYISINKMRIALIWTFLNESINTQIRLEVKYKQFIITQVYQMHIEYWREWDAS